MPMTAKRIAFAAAVTLFLLACPQVGIAQQPAEQGPTIGQMAAGLNPMNWRMPQWKMPNFRQMLPGADEKARIKKKKEGLFDEVTKTASNSWMKTKEMLNPQKLNPVRFMPASSRTPSPGNAQESKPGFFRSLWSPAPPVERDNATVTDFLRQSRPSP